MKSFILFLFLILLSATKFIYPENSAEPSASVPPSLPTAETNAAVVTSAPTKEPYADSYDCSRKSYSIDDFAGKYKTQGRCPEQSFFHPATNHKNTGVLINHCASSFSFNAYCEGDAVIELYTPSLWGQGCIYFNVYVDGVKISNRSDYKIYRGKLHTFVLGSDLSKGMHTFLIERQSGASMGPVYVSSVSISGEIVNPPEQNSIFIEFIGDSITSGYGALYPYDSEGEWADLPSASAYHDATKAYAYLAAKKLNADYSIIALPGIGATSGYVQKNMIDIYTMTCAPCNDESEWGFNRIADIVVINLGTNDAVMAYRGKITHEQMQNGFRDFALLVREKNPYSKIIWAYGALGNDAENYIHAVIDSLGGENAGYYYVSLISDASGGEGHPSVKAHEQNAARLADAIKEILLKS